MSNRSFSRLSFGRVGSGLAGALVAATVLVTSSAPLSASELIDEYTAWLSPRDAQSSRGMALTDICAIVQQDRANFHRFGLRDDGDGADTVFATQEARARIAQDCRYAIEAFEPYARELLLQRGEPVFVWVRVYGENGRPDYILVREGAG